MLPTSRLAVAAVIVGGITTGTVVGFTHDNQAASNAAATTPPKPQPTSLSHLDQLNTRVNRLLSADQQLHNALRSARARLDAKLAHQGAAPAAHPSVAAPPAAVVGAPAAPPTYAQAAPVAAPAVAQPVTQSTTGASGAGTTGESETSDSSDGGSDG